VARRKRKKDRAKGVRIVSIAEMMQIRNELERVSRPGTSPVDQAAVLTLAMQFAGTYYKTGKGQLRRTFPKATEVVLFHGVPQSKSGAAILSQRREEHEQAG
jgi:hypothetical protein